MGIKNKKIFIAYLGIGTNKGNRKENINKALLLLCSHKRIKILKISQMLKNPPQEGIKTGYFLNGAIKIETSLSPIGLLRYCKNIEKMCGRSGRTAGTPIENCFPTATPRREREYFSRTIDLDILFYEDKIIHTKTLTIPHPMIENRYFVLLPLIDLDKNLIHPKQNISLRRIYKKSFGFKRRFR